MRAPVRLRWDYEEEKNDSEPGVSVSFYSFTDLIKEVTRVGFKFHLKQSVDM